MKAASIEQKGGGYEIQNDDHKSEDILIDADKLQVEVARIKKTDGTGGLGIEQTAGALRMMCKNRNDVHVVYDKEICGIAEIDNTIISNQINRLIFERRWIVFPYAINQEHQISVVIDNHNDSKIMIVTDSLGIDRTNDDNLKQFAALIGCQERTKGSSNYHNQPNTNSGWECGVHTVYNSLNIINNEICQTKVYLELDGNLEEITKLWMQHAVLVEEEQKQRERSRQEKSDLLHAIEQLRHKEGNFKDTSAQDDLRFLADALQMEMWHNLDRRIAPDTNEVSNSGRDTHQEQSIRERQMYKRKANRGIDC